MSLARHRPAFRTQPSPATLVMTIFGVPIEVEAIPERHRTEDFDAMVGDSGPLRMRPAMGGGLTSRPRRPVHIPPGGCDVYEGDNGTIYVCCKDASGTHIDCYKAVIHHQDPWGPG